MSLFDRCANYLEQAVSFKKAPGSATEDLASFIQSEIGRAADPSLQDAKPLVLYFADDDGREAMVQLIQHMKSGMVERKWPR